MSRALSEQERVTAYLVKRKNGATERQVNDNVFPLEPAAYVRARMDAISGKGEIICRVDDKGVRRYYAPGKAPLQYGRQPRPALPPVTNMYAVPEVQPPRPIVPEAPPASPPKEPRKLRPRANMPQPATRGPSDILADHVASFIARGGKIEKLANGVVSRPLKVIGTAACPVDGTRAGIRQQRPERHPSRRRGQN